MSYSNRRFLLQICKYLILAFVLKPARCVPQSPCPNIFEYQFDGANNLFGFMQVPNPDDNSNRIRLVVQFSVGNSIQGFSGNIELAKPRSEVIEDLLQNRPLQYKLYFPYWTNIAPTITKISVNGNQLCYGYPINKNLVSVLTIVDLEHTLVLKSSGGPQMPSARFPVSNVDNRRPPYDFRNQPKNFKSNDFNPQQPKDSVNIYSPFNTFQTEGNKRYSGNPFFQVMKPPQGGHDWHNPFPGDSRPPYNTFNSDSSALGVTNGVFPSNDNGFMQPFDDFHFDFTDQPGRRKWHGSIPNDDSSSLGATNDPFPNNDDGFVQPVHNFHFDFTDRPGPQRWHTTTTTSPRPPAVSRVPPTQVPRDSDVEDLPTADFNLVQRPFSNVCGISVNANELLVNGNRFAKGLHPWLAALFFQNIEGLKFICGTSLISRKHVVTAAHCVRNRTNKFTPDDLWIVLGRENLQQWSNDGAQIIQAESTYIHPEYKVRTADADIAVIVLRDEVVMSTLVRPICLWTDDSDINLVVGRTGTIVGWGKDELGRISTAEPRQIVFPIVSEEDCLRSNSAFREITSNRTFCGGYRNNSGPCNGDSGSGFFMRLTERWVLRGIVSMSLIADQNCDLSQYIVFTDAAKYTNWLLSFVRYSF